MVNQSPGPAPSPQSPWAWHIQETYRGLITLCVEALKMLGLVNGGAAVALLTYAGALVGRGGSAPPILAALIWYATGLAASVGAFLVAYVTQLRLFVEERARHTGGEFKRRHGLGIAIGLALALYATFAFGIGCFKTAAALGAVEWPEMPSVETILNWASALAALIAAGLWLTSSIIRVNYTEQNQGEWSEAAIADDGADVIRTMRRQNVWNARAAMATAVAAVCQAVALMMH